MSPEYDWQTKKTKRATYDFHDIYPIENKKYYQILIRYIYIIYIYIIRVRVYDIYFYHYILFLYATYIYIYVSIMFVVDDVSFS